MVDTIKFSQMTDGGDLANGEKTPGLLDGANVLFNNPWTFLPSGTTADRPAPSSLINYRLRFNTTDQLYEYYDAVLGVWTQLQESAFTAGPFITYTADVGLPDAQNLGALSNGILKQTVTLGSATLDIAVNGTDYYGPGFVIPGASGGTGVNNGSLTITLAGGATGFVLTSDSSGNATWAANGYLTDAVLLDPSGDQTILGFNLALDTGSMYNPLGYFFSGSTSGGVQGKFTGYAPTNGMGSLSLIADDNADNYDNVLTNVSTTAAREWGLPDESGTIALVSSPSSGYVLLNPAADQTILNAFNLIMDEGSMVAPTMLPGNLSLTGNTLSSTDTNGNVNIVPNGTGKICGLQADGLSGSSAPVQFVKDGLSVTVLIGSFINSSTGPATAYFKSRGATVGSFATAVQNGDALGSQQYYGTDGTDSLLGAIVYSKVDGAVSTGIIPTRFEWYTNNSAGVGTLGMTLDSSQNLLVTNGGIISGSATGSQASDAGIIQAVGLAGVNASFIASSYWNGGSGSAPTFWTYKSRSATVGSFTTVQTGDELGRWEAFADDGTQFSRAGDIVIQAEGTVSTGIVPGVWSFRTTNAAGVISFAMSINSSQLVTTQTLFSNTTIQANSGLISGKIAGGMAGSVTLYSPTTLLGNTVFIAANNAGNYSNILTNASTSAARTWTLPDASGTIALTGSSVASITGTANQVLANGTVATPQTGAVTLTLPQDIGTSSTPTFAGANLGNINIAVNTISSINTNGNIIFAPNGNGICQAVTTAQAFDFQLISSNANAFPALRVYRNTSTQIGGVQWGVNDAFNAAGDGAFFVNNVAGGKIFLRDSTGNALTISAGVTSLSNPLGASSGGTGYANPGTWSNGGNVAFSGSFTFTGTLTGNTSVTFPTSGTLATTSQLPSLGNYTFSGNNMTVASGTMNFNLPGNNLTLTSGSDTECRAISTSASGSPYFSMFRNTSTLIGAVQAGCTSGGAGGGTGMLYFNGITNGPHFFMTNGNAFCTLSPLGSGITLGDFTINAGALNVGVSSGGGGQVINIFAPTNLLGRFQIAALDNAGNFTGSLQNASITAARTWTLPDITGTIDIPIEGTFSATVTAATPGDLSVVYTQQSSQYTRTGNLVWVRWNCNFTPTFTTASGSLRLSGLPFTIREDSGGQLIYASGATPFTYPASHTFVTPYGQGGTTYATLSANGSGQNATDVIMSNVTSGTQQYIEFTMMYRV